MRVQMDKVIAAMRQPDHDHGNAGLGSALPAIVNGL
jgi:hypothetical protein